MSSNNTSSTPGGVRNLRALFETKTSDLSTSPPSRGRSPAKSDISTHSRPVSRVRANFISVERPGDINLFQPLGLKKSNESSSGADVKQRIANTMDSKTADSEATPKGPTTLTNGSEQTTNGEPHKRHASKNSLDGGLGSILKGSAFEPSSPSKKFEDSKNLTSVLSSSQIEEKKASHQKTNGDATAEKNAASMVSKMKQPLDWKKSQAPPAKLVMTKDAMVVKPPPTRQVQTKVTTKAPVLPRTPRTPITPVSAAISKPSPKVGAEPIAKTEATTKSLPIRQSKATEGKKENFKDTTTTEARKDNQSNPTTGTVPRSPVTTTKKSSSATAPTASSTAKIETSHAPNVTNGTKAVKSPLDRKVSTLRRPPRSSAVAETTSSLAKKPSRSSLPGQPGDRPQSRSSTSKHADEGFLARMMRPTASSAQKVHEKVQINSPPRGSRAAGSTQLKVRKGTVSSSSDEGREIKDSPPSHDGGMGPPEPKENGNTGLVQAAT